jgi:DNA-binding transcriptional regulator GbsR (MarR family)
MDYMTALEKYIEDVGLFYERFGLAKMSGRILGLLMATDEEKVSFDDMVIQLQASKGSISGNINFLLKQKLIEKFMVTGDRKSYYKFSNENVFSIIDNKLDATEYVKQIFVRGNDLHKDKESTKHKSITEVIQFYDFLEEELPKLKEKWKSLKKTG